jgi:hypothetical protein
MGNVPGHGQAGQAAPGTGLGQVGQVGQSAPVGQAQPRVYAAVYSNVHFSSWSCWARRAGQMKMSIEADGQVPVFEAMIRGISVMRRTSDSWVNATQILKVAGIHKSARTKILEKEVLTGVHEKVQGGCESFFNTVPPC